MKLKVFKGELIISIKDLTVCELVKGLAEPEASWPAAEPELIHTVYQLFSKYLGRWSRGVSKLTNYRVGKRFDY